MVSWLAVHCIDSAVFGHRVCILALAWYHWRQPGVCHDGRIVVAETQPEPSPCAQSRCSRAVFPVRLILMWSESSAGALCMVGWLHRYVADRKRKEAPVLYRMRSEVGCWIVARRPCVAVLQQNISSRDSNVAISSKMVCITRSPWHTSSYTQFGVHCLVGTSQLQI